MVWGQTGRVLFGFTRGSPCFLDTPRAGGEEEAASADPGRGEERANGMVALETEGSGWIWDVFQRESQ